MATYARVTHFRKEYEGELLYFSTYPNYARDEHGKVTAIRRHPQRVGLLIDGVPTHFTIPEQVTILKDNSDAGKEAN